MDNTDFYQLGWNLGKALYELGQQSAPPEFARKKSSRGKSSAKPTGRSYTRGAGKKKPPGKAGKSSDLKTKKSCSKGTACGRSCIASTKTCGGTTLKSTVRAASEYLKRGTSTSGKKLSKADRRRYQELADDAQRQLDARDAAKKPKAKPEPEKGGAMVPVGGKISQAREAAEGSKRKIPERKRTREEALVQLYRMKKMLHRAGGHKALNIHAQWKSFEDAPSNLNRYMTIGSGGMKTEIRRFKKKPPTQAELTEQRRRIREAKAREKELGPERVAAARDFHHFKEEASANWGDTTPWKPYPSARHEEARLAMMQGDIDKATKLYKQELEIENQRRDNYRARTTMITVDSATGQPLKEGDDPLGELTQKPEFLLRSENIRRKRSEMISQAMYNLETGRPLTQQQDREILGVELTGDSDADFTAIRNQYRNMARELHPDMGGNVNDFIALEEEYRPIKNHYDVTGEVLPSQKVLASEQDYEDQFGKTQYRFETDLAVEAGQIAKDRGLRTTLTDAYTDRWYTHDESPNK